MDSPDATHDGFMQASQAVLEHAGGAWGASLNHYNTGGGCMVTTQQVDEWVYVVGQDSFSVGRYTLAEWTGADGQDDVPMMDCDDEAQVWELFRLMREDCLLWQCGACDGWIFTSDRPRIGALQCSTCCTGGVDFNHADRQTS